MPNPWRARGALSSLARARSTSTPAGPLYAPSANAARATLARPLPYQQARWAGLGAHWASARPRIRQYTQPARSPASASAPAFTPASALDSTIGFAQFDQPTYSARLRARAALLNSAVATEHPDGFRAHYVTFANVKRGTKPYAIRCYRCASVNPTWEVAFPDGTIRQYHQECKPGYSPEMRVYTTSDQE
jgi:hypothetical protein